MKIANIAFNIAIISFMVAQSAFCGPTINYDKITELLKNTTYNNDKSIEVLEFKYQPETTKVVKEKVVKEVWRSNIELKNNSDTKLKCETIGTFILKTGKPDSKSGANILFSGFIEKGSSKSYTDGIAIDINKLTKYSGFLVTTACEPIAPIRTEDIDARELSLFEKASYEVDPGIKIVNASFKKVGSDQYYDIYESNVMLKSCYKMKVECSGGGGFETEDGGSNSTWNFFPLSYIEKEANKEGKGLIKIRKDNLDITTAFKASITCDPVYSEHPNMYPPNHKYWKQFLPKNNECQKSKK